jgi:outer membrane beta-barrel protein
VASGQGWDPEIEGGEVMVVQQKPVRLRHEFAFGGGVLPKDAFYTGYTVNAAYTFHLTDLLGWQVASGFLSETVDSGLDDELLEDYQVQPTRFETVDAGLLTHLVVKPFYGKRSFLNGPVLPSETSFLLGVGTVRYSQSLRAAAEIGVVLRIHISSWFSVRLDVRDLLPVDPAGGLENIIHVTLAGAFNVGEQPE